MEKDAAFIQKASKIFFENGAKTVTMDDLAKEFGISKKTLYIKYTNKDAILEDVLTYVVDRLLERLKDLDDSIDNAIVRMFSRDEQIERIASTNDSILLKQLIKYYPDLFHKNMLYFSEKFSETLIHNIEKGRSQGFYRTDFDARLYAKMYFQLIMSYENSFCFDTNLISKDEYHHETLKFYMNAITTEKGKQLMKEKGF